LHRDAGAAGRFRRAGPSPPREDRRWIAAGELAALLDRLGELIRDPADLGLQLRQLLRHDRTGPGSVRGERDQALLGAVVQVASMRRRASSAAATILVREAVSWVRLSAFAIAVPMSSVELGHALFGVGRQGRPRRLPAPIAPHSRPSTTIGAATPDRIPTRRRRSP